MNTVKGKRLGIALCCIAGLAFSSNAFSQLFFSQDSNSNGLYEINVTTGQATLVGTSGVNAGTAGLAPSQSEDLLFGSEPFGLLEVQADGSGSVFVGGATMEGMAYCSQNDTLYGSLNGSFFTVNYTTGALVSSLAAPGFDMEGMACDVANGIVYGIGDSTSLAAFDIGAGTWSTVGDLGLNLDSGGLAFDPSGVLYAIGVGTGNSLITIDPGTAAVTTIGPLGTTAAGGLAWVGPGGPVQLGPSIPVPTMSWWALVLMAGLIGLFGVARSRA